MRSLMFALFVAMSMAAIAAEDFDRQEIEQRIQPVGKVRLEANPDAATATPKTEEVAVKKEPGQEVYEQFCSTCHRDGLAGAPKFRDEAGWKSRLAAKKDVAGLAASAIKGVNAMPPKGTCAECSEEDLKNAIQYMLPKS